MQCEKSICALYCRVATVEQAALTEQSTVKEQRTTQEQERRLRKFAQDMGYTNTAVYCDNGYSGDTHDRPAFAALNADIAAEKVGVVLAVNISRLWRNVTEFRAWLGRMDKKGITVLFKEPPAMQQPEDGVHQTFESLDKHKKRKQARHTVRTPPPVSQTR